MSPERAAIIDAMMLQGGGPRESAYSQDAPVPPPQEVYYPPVPGESWLEKIQREALELKMRMIDSQTR